MQILATMRDGDAGPKAAEADSSITETSGSSGSVPTPSKMRRPYEPPRIERRIPVVSNTMISGSECTFGGPCED